MYKDFDEDKVQITFTNAGIVALIIKMYQTDILEVPYTYSLFDSKNMSHFPQSYQELDKKCIKRQRKQCDLETEAYRSQQQILKLVKVYDKEQMWDSILIEESPKNIIQLCQTASEGHAFQSTLKVTYNNQTKQYQAQDALWFVPTSYQTCSHWLINEIEKWFSIFHAEKQSEKSKLVQQLEIKHDIDSLDKFWKDYVQGQKKQIIRNQVLQLANVIYKDLKQKYESLNLQEYKKKIHSNDTKWILDKEDELKWLYSFIPFNSKFKIFDDQFDIKMKQTLDRVESNFIYSCSFFTLQETMQSTSYILKKLLMDVQDKMKVKIIEELISNEEKVKQNFRPKNQKKKNKKKLNSDKAQDIINTSPDAEAQVSTSICSQREMEKPKFVDLNEVSERLSSHSLRQKQNKTNLIETLFTPPNSPLNEQLEFSFQPCQEQSPLSMLIEEMGNDGEGEEEEEENISVEWKTKKTQELRKLKGVKQKKKPTCKNQKTYDDEVLEIKESELTPNSPVQQQDTLKQDKEEQSTKQNENMNEILDEAVLVQAQQKLEEKLSKDLYEFSQDIINAGQKTMLARKIVFDRVQFVVKRVFTDYDADVRLYGSSATGLALSESDIDITVIGLEIVQRAQLHVPMKMLANILNEFNWVKNLNIILTSSVPVLKLEIIVTTPFNSVSKKLPAYLASEICEYDYSYLSVTQPIEIGKFKVDITFNEFLYNDPNTYDHLGLISTDLVLQWTQIYSELQPLVLFFKILLKKRGLSSQYKGGLSSFCTIILVVSFLEANYQSQNRVQESLGSVFIKMLEFYGIKFDSQSQGVFYQGFGISPFIELPKVEHPIPIQIFSPMSHEVISSSCAFTQMILRDLKSIYNSALEERMRRYMKLKYKRRIRKPQKDFNFVYNELNKLTPLLGGSSQ